jgi:hypothetical protein
MWAELGPAPQIKKISKKKGEIEKKMFKHE